MLQRNNILPREHFKKFGHFHSGIQQYLKICVAYLGLIKDFAAGYALIDTVISYTMFVT